MLNKVLLIGNLGGDVEIRYTPSGKAIANFSVATSETWTKDGQKETRTEWHKIVAFGKLAEVCGEYLSKGMQIYIEGKNQTDKYEKDGQTHYSTKVVANTMKMLGGKKAKDPQDEEPKPGQTDMEEAPF